VNPLRVKIYFENFQVQEDENIHNLKFNKELFIKNKMNLESKLEKWINRELETIFKSFQIENIKSMIVSLISVFELDSDEFRDEIKKYLKDYTDIFIRELCLFSRTKLTMDVYDSKVCYVPCVNRKKRKREDE
jgi:hypothetical protein